MVNLILAHDDLENFARDFATKLRPGDAVLLEGPLGAGKTTLSRALIRALCDDPMLDIQSPTFPLCLTYDAPDGTTIWHYDLYRLPDNADISELGWDEARRDGIAIVEWPDKARADQMHMPTLRLSLSFTDDELIRRITIDETRKTARYDHAFIMAAGMGSRMRPFTDHTPKPMAEIYGQTLIERIIRQCRQSGIGHILVNSFHLAEKLEEHIGNTAMVIREKELLDTGGGIKNILKHVPENKPFYCLSGDSWWMDISANIFETMDAVWDDDRYDLILVLQPIKDMVLTPGHGDYDFVDGKPVRSLDKTGTHMWTSHRLVHPRLFKDTPDGPFSFLTLMDKAEREGRLGAVEMPGTWLHLTDMNDVEHVDNWMRSESDEL